MGVQGKHTRNPGCLKKKSGSRQSRHLGEGLAHKKLRLGGRPPFEKGPTAAKRSMLGIGAAGACYFSVPV